MADDSSYVDAACGYVPAKYTRAGVTTDTWELASSDTRTATSIDKRVATHSAGLLDGAVSWWDGDEFVYILLSEVSRPIDGCWGHARGDSKFLGHVQLVGEALDPRSKWQHFVQTHF